MKAYERQAAGRLLSDAVYQQSMFDKPDIGEAFLPACYISDTRYRHEAATRHIV